MKILTAKVTDVPIGHLAVSGLMAEDSSFYVGIPQIVDLNLIPPNRSAKQLQALSGIAFQTHKLKTELHPKAINAIALNDFGRVIVAFAKTGNIAAQELRDDLVGLSLYQLFSDAFKVKFEQEERQEHLKARQEGKQVRHTLTDAIDWYIKNTPGLSANYIQWVYVNCSDSVNLGLFGRKSKRVCVDLKVNDRSKLRDCLTTDELRWLSQIEELAARLIIYQGYEPLIAVKEAISRSVIPTVSRIA